MKNRIIASILVITMILPLGACGGGSQPKESRDQVLVEGVVSDENLILSCEGVQLKLDPVNITEELKAKITKSSNQPVLDEESGIELDVYDFAIDGLKEFAGVIELTIPLVVEEGNTPGAAYLNETSGQWESVSFRYDKESRSVIILTDHLSKYGVFSVSNEGKRRARIEFLDINSVNEDKDFIAAVEEYSIGGLPANQCIDIGSNVAGDALQLGGDFLGNMVQAGGYLAYGDDVLSSIGDHLGSLGLLVSVVQIGNSIYNGNINQALVGSLKTSHSYIVGKLVGKLSNSVLSASMASVAIVDYAINKFGTSAIEGRADIYRDAYSIYYMKGEDGFTSSADWFQKLYPMFKDQTMSQDELKIEIDKMVTIHCNEFWTTNKLGVDYYVSEARERMAWTGGGAGLNQVLKDSISAEKRSIMYNDILPGVFYQIARKINMENENKLREEYKELTNYLNKVIKLNIVDLEKKYPNYKVKIAPLNDKAIVENWTGKLNKDGELSTSFTLYGHMYAGSPNQVQIFEPDANIDVDEPVRIVDFKVVGPVIQIDLAEDMPSLDEINGLWSSSSLMIMDFDLGPPPTDKESTSGNDSEEGCDLDNIEIYNMVKTQLEAVKGLAIPTIMNFKLDEEGKGIIDIIVKDSEEDDDYYYGDEDEDDKSIILDARYNNGDVEGNGLEQGLKMKFTGKISKSEGKITLIGEFSFNEGEQWFIGNWNGIK